MTSMAETALGAILHGDRDGPGPRREPRPAPRAPRLWPAALRAILVAVLIAVAGSAAAEATTSSADPSAQSAALAAGDYATGAPGDPDAETYVGWAAARPIPQQTQSLTTTGAVDGGGLASAARESDEIAADAAADDREPSPNGIGATLGRWLGADSPEAAHAEPPLARALERRSAAAARDGVTLELTSIATGVSVRVVAAGRLDADEAVDIAVPPEVAEALGADVDAPFLVLVTPATAP